MLALLTMLVITAPPDGWTEAARVDGIVIYNRQKPGSDVREVRAIGSFDAPLAKVHAVLDDGGHYQDFMPFAKESRILKRDPATDSVWSYERLNPPLLSERDYVVHMTHETRGTTIVHKFKQANAMGPPPIKDVVRVEILDGGWELEPIDGGKRTRATYYVLSSPGGSVPMWLVNAANNNAVPEIFKAIREAIPKHSACKPASP